MKPGEEPGSEGEGPGVNTEAETCAGWRLGKIRMTEGRKEGRKLSTSASSSSSAGFLQHHISTCAVFPDPSYGRVSSGVQIS